MRQIFGPQHYGSSFSLAFGSGGVPPVPRTILISASMITLVHDGRGVVRLVDVGCCLVRYRKIGQSWIAFQDVR